MRDGYNASPRACARASEITYGSVIYERPFRGMIGERDYYAIARAVVSKRSFCAVQESLRMERVVVALLFLLIRADLIFAVPERYNGTMGVSRLRKWDFVTEPFFCFVFSK